MLGISYFYYLYLASLKTVSFILIWINVIHFGDSKAQIAVNVLEAAAESKAEEQKAAVGETKVPFIEWFRENVFTIIVCHFVAGLSA